MQLTGRVTAVTVKPTKFPNKNKTSIRIDGGEDWWGFLGERQIVKNGDIVSFDGERDGQWCNGKYLKIIEGGNGGAVTDPGAYFDRAVPPTPSGTVGRSAAEATGREAYSADREARIVRQNATTSAIALFGIQAQLDPEHFKSLTTEELWDRVVELHGRIYELNMNSPQGA